MESEISSANFLSLETTLQVDLEQVADLKHTIKNNSVPYNLIKGELEIFSWNERILTI